MGRTESRDAWAGGDLGDFLGLRASTSRVPPTGNRPRRGWGGNNVQQFAATLATVEIGEGAANTTIAGGSGT